MPPRSIVSSVPSRITNAFAAAHALRVIQRTYELTTRQDVTGTTPGESSRVVMAIEFRFGRREKIAYSSARADNRPICRPEELLSLVLQAKPPASRMPKPFRRHGPGAG